MRFSSIALHLSLLLASDAFSLAPSRTRISTLTTRPTSTSSKHTSTSTSTSTSHTSTSTSLFVFGGNKNNNNNRNNNNSNGTRIISNSNPTNAPILSRWTVNPDGSITGSITNASDAAIKNNSTFTTGVIRDKLTSPSDNKLQGIPGNKLVTTTGRNGKKYYLKGNSSRLFNRPKPTSNFSTYTLKKKNKKVDGTTRIAKPGAKPKPLAKSKTKTKPLTAKQKAAAAAANVSKTMALNKIKGTVSISSTGARTTRQDRNVPSLSNWSLNSDDGSITGSISGSTDYKNGQTITTSKMKGNKNSVGGKSDEIAVSVSGSKYYLVGGNRNKGNIVKGKAAKAAAAAAAGGTVNLAGKKNKGTIAITEPDDNNNNAAIGAVAIAAAAFLAFNNIQGPEVGSGVVDSASNKVETPTSTSLSGPEAAAGKAELLVVPPIIPKGIEMEMKMEAAVLPPPVVPVPRKPAASASKSVPASASVVTEATPKPINPKLEKK
mmetsp:Transcript_19107/g.28120  ORF Transcript_19107/g.28120 Transcript_19107/m.28120 type:complete len:490 (+) Transcript_19107:246-1715(+)